MRPRDLAGAIAAAERRKAKRDSAPKKRNEQRPKTRAAITLKLLPDRVLDTLFRQSIIGSYRGEPYIDGVRRLARLIEAELQGQVYKTAHVRAKQREQRKLSKTRPPMLAVAR